MRLSLTMNFQRSRDSRKPAPTKGEMRESSRAGAWGRRQDGRPRQSLVSKAELALLAGLMILPGWAAWHLSATILPRFVLGYFAVISTTTFLVYRHDKMQAISGGWRTPESTLHFLEIVGGWPSAFLAQRVFRHKTSKRSFQLTFWAVVALHQFLCFDLVQQWQYSRQAAGALAKLPQFIFG